MMTEIFLGGRTVPDVLLSNKNSLKLLATTHKNDDDDDDDNDLYFFVTQSLLIFISKKSILQLSMYQTERATEKFWIATLPVL